MLVFSYFIRITKEMRDTLSVEEFLESFHGVLF